MNDCRAHKVTGVGVMLTPLAHQLTKSALKQTVMAANLQFRARRNRIDLILF
jgi:hypothetical protein